MSDEGFVVADSLKELGDMVEVRSALQNLCMAAQLATPRNLSFTVIDAFLKSTSNLESELSSFRKAPIVAAFVDHVLQVNAANWISDADFLDMPALKALWESWWCARKGAWKTESTAGQGGQSSQQQAGGGKNQGGNGGQGDAGGKGGGKKNRNNKKFGNGGGGGQQGGGNNGGGQGGNYQAFGGRDGMQQPTLYMAPPSEKNLCRKYNDGNCPNPHGRCSFPGKYGPVKLYHLCNYLKRDNNENKLCMERHSRAEVHKN
jgi:hypothetical protein